VQIGRREFKKVFWLAILSFSVRRAGSHRTDLRSKEFGDHVGRGRFRSASKVYDEYLAEAGKE
jgi:hypothetical protein